MISPLLCLPILLLGQEPPDVEETESFLGLPMVRFELTDDGYKMILDREAAERLRDAIDGVEDPDALADTIRKKKILDRDEESRNETELIARMAAKELPKFKKELHDKMGPNGVTIKVIGVKQEPEKERPILKRIGERLPEVVRERVQKMATIARIKPLFWAIQPRE